MQRRRSHTVSPSDRPPGRAAAANRGVPMRAGKGHAARPLPAGTPRRMANAAPWPLASRFALPAFILVYLLVASRWQVPGWWAALYLAASIVCFVAYAVDKSAAVAGRGRVAESTLHLLGLAGGWPGAILAQQLLRHKSSKASFRSAFWGTVVLNVAAFLALNTPVVARLIG